ncbi:hypothetical protein [Micromonospora sp. NPDC049679]|uniref:hypothetical protein n=1 Tax=Micromonospora sp. NPDC049679 TaxID=3155920 RepID=UPI003402BDF3
MTTSADEPPDDHAPLPAHATRERVELPEWMRNPPPPRMTLGRRWSRWVSARPRLQAAREAWWAWRDRSRLSDRYPRATPVISFVIVAVTATVLVAGALYLSVRILTGAGSGR